ncbi:hypothetical protein P8452_03248 [Trifolium repens]|nr:hypothetical protein P8452_03248 [Trifolium repens]
MDAYLSFGKFDINESPYFKVVRLVWGTDVYTYDSDLVAERKRREIRRVHWTRQKKSTQEEEVDELHSLVIIFSTIIFMILYSSFIYANHVFDKMLMWMLINISITKVDFLLCYACCKVI